MTDIFIDIAFYWLIALAVFAVASLWSGMFAVTDTERQYPIIHQAFKLLFICCLAIVGVLFLLLILIIITSLPQLK
jgi:hypothetical protein